MTIPRPIQILNRNIQAYGLTSTFNEANKLRARGRQIGAWPDWCYCPSTYFLKLLMQKKKLTGFCSRALVLAAWRASKGIYRYDSTLRDELWRTSITGDIPTELLFHLPEFCVYIEVGRTAAVPDFKIREDYLHGFFAYMNYCVMSRRPELCFLLDYERNAEFFMSLPLSGTIDNSIDFQLKMTTSVSLITKTKLDVDHTRVADVATPLMSLLLYLCSDEPDLDDEQHTGRKPSQPRPLTKIRRGKVVDTGKLAIPSKATQWDVGYRLGAALRKSKEEPSEVPAESSEVSVVRQASPIGHIRRAHWHTFWTGPKDDPERRRRILKWLPPIAVNLKNLGELIPTVHPVTE